MSRFVHELPFGADVRGDRTHFRVWAPGCRELSVRIDDTRQVPLTASADGWFSGDAECAAGAGYRYVLPDGTALADPASRFQPGGVGGPSAVIDPGRYRWQHARWQGRPWSEAVVYELHVGALGGFAGVQSRLADLADLGITALQLMPIAQFAGERNWGYDGVLPFAPARCYGTPDELKALVDTAHGLGLMVMLDVVYNHFGPDGNVLPRLAPAFFRDDVSTPWGPAIDFRQPQVREFFIHNALYWLMEYRFDGLRLDAVHAITERDWLPELAERVRDAVEPGRHVHLVVENEANDARLLREGFDAQWNDDAHHVLHVLLTGESDAYYADYAEDPTAGLARWLSDGFVFQGQPCGHRDGAPRGQPSGDLPTTAFINFLHNHDQVGNRAFGERLSQLAGDQALRAATALLLLAPQVPMLFMGEEWNARSPFLYFTDHHGELADAVREGRRREFEKFPAFRDPDRREAIPDPNDPATFSASTPDPADARTGPGAAHRAWVRGLLRLRHERVVPHLDGTRSLGAEIIGPAAVEARWRLGDDSVLSILVNLGDAPAPRPGGNAATGDELLFESAPGSAAAASTGTLPARSLVATLGAAPEGSKPT
jgi:maltooligosyltrehalose trehalohydrolase